MRKYFWLAWLLPLAAFGQGSAIITIHNNSTGQIWADGWSQGGFDSFGGSGVQIAAGATANQFITWASGPTGALYYHDCTDTTQFHTDQIADTPGVNFDVYISGTCDNYTGGGVPPSTNSEYCVTINNTSGTGTLYGLANVDTGVPYILDGCGNNEVYVPAGQTKQICLDEPPTAHVALFTDTGPGASIQLQAGPGCYTGGIYNPAPVGNVASTNLVGTPIPNGSTTQPGNTNNVTIGFGGTGVQDTNTPGLANGPINFTGTNGGVASNNTLIAGFSADFTELVAVASAVQKNDIDTVSGLNAVKAVENGIASSVSPLHSDLAGIASSASSINSSVQGLDMAVTAVGTDVNNLKPDLDGILSDANYLPGLSNLDFTRNQYLLAVSNQVNQVVSNTSGTLGDLDAMSNYVARSFGYTNDALGGLSEQWADGVNRNNLTNNASAMVGAGALATMQTTGDNALSSAEGVGVGPASDITGGADASFWTISATLGSKTYSYDLNPMDNAGIAEIAGICRAWEQWVICFVFVCLVMNLFDKYFAAMAQTAQTQSNRAEILGNSVGQLSGAVYLPVMIGCMLAIPLFVATALSSSGASWFAAVATPPLTLSGHSHPIEQAIWLADQFMPLNFAIASVLWYLFIRLTAAPVWATSVVILKTLIS